jgi:hypothetical protein
LGYRARIRFHCGNHLRAGHHTHAQQLDVIGLDQAREGSVGIEIEIAIDDLVILTSLQRSGEPMTETGNRRFFGRVSFG